ncbi:hypothetical protein N9A04_00635 [Rickettsiales bacterium]|nr:hypothetical protein [Rickettsiales bacterium]
MDLKSIKNNNTTAIIISGKDVKVHALHNKHDYYINTKHLDSFAIIAVDNRVDFRLNQSTTPILLSSPLQNLGIINNIDFIQRKDGQDIDADAEIYTIFTEKNKKSHARNGIPIKIISRIKTKNGQSTYTTKILNDIFKVQSSITADPTHNSVTGFVKIDEWQYLMDSVFNAGIYLNMGEMRNIYQVLSIYNNLSKHVLPQLINVNTSKTSLHIDINTYNSELRLNRIPISQLFKT